jgi:hypothetical protein
MRIPRLQEKAIDAGMIDGADRGAGQALIAIAGLIRSRL